MNTINPKTRLALILKTGRLRLWFYYPATRHYCYLSEAGEYGREYNPTEFAQFFHRDDMETLRSTVFDICDCKQDTGKVAMRSRADNESECLHYEISISVVSRDDEGIPTSIMGIQHDVTEEYRRKEKIRQLLVRYHTIFNSSLLDMLYYDNNGVLTDINERASKAFNVKNREQVLDGSFLLKNNPFYCQIPIEEMGNLLTSSIIDFREFQTPEYRLEEFDLKGKMYYESTINPIRNDKGELEGVFMSGHDISEMVESYHRQEDGVKKLKKGTENIKQYIANIDYALSVSGVQLVNYYPHAYTFEIINRETSKRLRMSQLRCIRLASPRFRRTVNSLLNRMDHLTKNGITQSIETEIRDKKGRQIWLLFNMVPMLDAEGHVERYFGMFRDVTDMVETEQRLAVETKKAQETEQLKQTFLTNMSYEIRTPLNNILGFAKLFTEVHDECDEPLFVSQIKENTSELLLLVNDILYISRLNANMEEYKKEEIDFAMSFESMCRNGMANIQPDIQVLINQPYNSLVIDVDIYHLSMIIHRLCTLSCLFTSHGSIIVNYEYHHGELTFHLEDTGLGYTKEELPHIFEHFSRDVNGEIRGSGLDLPIVQLLTRQMGGNIEVQSEYQKGTSVWVSIPCTASVIEKKRS
ncbi:MAG: PAS domain-containing protein [Prevotella sp.]|nr:PAS domain-containing protein [Prevotella sp.]